MLYVYIDVHVHVDVFMLIIKVCVKMRLFSVIHVHYVPVNSLVWCFVGDVPFYIVRNSWGTDFGNNGYLYIKYGENVCGKNFFLEGVLFNISNIKKMCLVRIFWSRLLHQT